MRSVTFQLSYTGDSHPADRLFRRTTGLSRERIYHFNILENGTIILLGRLRGDLDLARRLLQEESDVLDHSISPIDGDAGLAYVHARPPPAFRHLLELPRSHEVFFEYPIEGTRGGGFRVVMIGESNDILQDAIADIPEAFEVEIEQIGPYPVEPGSLEGTLTERQREVLRVAMDIGYYEVPRQATHRDIAELMGLSVGTVSEHLQKIESRVFNAVMP